MNIYEQAAKRIAAGRRTEKELRDWLVAKGFDPGEAGEAVSEFKRDGYIDDYIYAKDFFAYAEDKCWGKARAYRELKRRGVGDETARDAYEEYAAESGTGEKDKALRALRKAASVFDLDEKGRLKEKAKARYARRLFSYGFDTVIIYEAIDEIEDELKEE